MAHEKLSPRQKMIGMMYLVLTAMLALNVSKEAVEAFRKIDNGLTLSIKNYNQKNSLIYQDFESSFAQFPEKTGPYRTKALAVKERADELFDYLQGLKIEIIKTAEGPETPAIKGNEVFIDDVEKFDDNNVPSEILIGSNDDKKAFYLRTMIDNYRSFLLETLDGKNPVAEEALKKSLNTDDALNRTTKEIEKWPNFNFQALPLVYVITMLSKIQLDVRNAETEVINYLFTQIDKSNFKFNKLDAIVIPNSNYVTLGSDYEAKVFISATDSTQQPNITVGGTRLDLDETGKGIYKVRASSLGPKKWGGVISLTAPDGSIKEYATTEQTYVVGESNVIVSPTAMNVMYYGIPNPIDVSIPSISPDKISIKVVNGTFSTEKVPKAGGGNFKGAWAVKPTAVGQVVQVIATANIDGKPVQYAPYEFRVKPIPPPIAVFGQKNTGSIPRATAAAQQGVFAILPDFDFDLQYQVTGFTILYTDARGDFEAKSTSSTLTTQQKDLISKLTRGKNLIIKDITALGPDGKTKELSAIFLKID
jgi:gliding motility-associated protein GldM